VLENVTQVMDLARRSRHSLQCVMEQDQMDLPTIPAAAAIQWQAMPDVSPAMCPVWAARGGILSKCS
jgi:hypothetical protein